MSAIIAAAAPTWAAAGAAPAAALGETTVTDVIVTATKRSELASKTPVAITAVTGQTLKSAGVTEISEIQNVTPSVVVGRDNFGVNISIRGVSSTDNTSKGDQGIAFNVDGIPIGRPIEEGLAFFDVDRVEVLRGPQGTLYGKSSTGGVVNVITNKPTFTFDASADAEFGNFNTRRGDVVLNVPVTDKFALRFAGNFNERDGYLEPKLAPPEYVTSFPPPSATVVGYADRAPGDPARNDQNDISGRVSGLYRFDNNASLLVTLTGGHVGGAGAEAAVLNNVLNKSGEAQREVYSDPFGSEVNDSYFNANGEFNADLGPVHMTYDGGHLTFQQHDLTSSTNDPIANWEGPPWTAQSVYYWRNYHGNFQTDSHELRFSNAEKGRVDWVLGVNWYREEINESDHRLLALITDPTLSGSWNAIDPVNRTIHTSYSVFGQGTLHLNDVFGLVVGLREGHDQLTRVGTFQAGPSPSCTNPLLDCIGGPNNGTESASKLTYRVGLNAQITPSQLLYVSVASGYKAGGFNDFDPTTHQVEPYAPESMTAYEVGYKGKPVSNVRFNSSLFYYDYAEQQLTSLTNVDGNVVVYTRLTPTKLYGWENELTWQATPDDLVDGALTLEKSEYVSHFMAGEELSIDWKGKSLDRTPIAVLTAGYSHTWRLNNGGSVKARVDTKYSASYLVSDVFAGIQYTQKAFTRTDLSVTYTAPGDRLYVQLFARNLEDNIQSTGNVEYSSPFSATGTATAVNEPRMFGVRMGVTY